MRSRGEGIPATTKTILERETTYNKTGVIGVGNIEIMEKEKN